MKLRALALALLITLTAIPATAQNLTTYEVTITNITPTQIIGPPVLATHSFRARIFNVGSPASEGLAAVAEDADSAALVASLQASSEVQSIAVGSGPILPGQSMTFEVQAGGRFSRLSAVGMLVTTNDAFFGLNNAVITGQPGVKRFTVPAYDSGTEANTESCEHIPGPPCGNPFVRVTDGAEGFVHVHRGMHGISDLSSFGYDWRNPSATITVVRK